MDDAIIRLTQIAQMLRDRDLAELAALRRQREAADTARRDFADKASAEHQALVDNLHYRRSHELPRRVWRERRFYALTHYEARAAALYETQKRVAAKSFGRAHVLEALSKARKVKPKAP